MVKLVNCVCLCCWCIDWDIWVSKDCCLFSRNTFNLCTSPNILANKSIFYFFLNNVSLWVLRVLRVCFCFIGFNSFLVCHSIFYLLFPTHIFFIFFLSQHECFCMPIMTSSIIGRLGFSRYLHFWVGLHPT